MGVMGFPPTLCNLENRRGICLENPKFCLVFVCFGLVVVFLMYYEECHYYHSDLVVIEITGLSPRSRKDSKVLG